MQEETPVTTIFLDEISFLKCLTARMPSAEECRQLGITADIPILEMHRTGHRGQLYRADKFTVALSVAPPPDAESARAEAISVLHHISEDLGNSAHDIDQLADAIGHMPRDVVRLARELCRLREADSVSPDAT
jgi:hypothetical protein